MSPFFELTRKMQHYLAEVSPLNAIFSFCRHRWRRRVWIFSKSRPIHQTSEHSLGSLQLDIAGHMHIPDISAVLVTTFVKTAGCSYCCWCYHARPVFGGRRQLTFRSKDTVSVDQDKKSPIKRTTFIYFGQ